MNKVQVELILGHRAFIRERSTPEGFTHDWEVYVRGDRDIQSFVDRVIFHLHESFPKPRRVVKEPPYCVKESGYAGFILNIEVQFKTKDEPKKATFDYDLFLQAAGAPVNNHRKEKLIFNYPSDEFRKKLIKAGGTYVDTNEKSSGGSTNPHLTSGGSSSSGGKSNKHLSSSHPAKLSPKNSFETLFGTPLKRSGPSAPLTTPSPTNSSTQSASSKSKGDKSSSSSRTKDKDKDDRSVKESSSVSGGSSASSSNVKNEKSSSKKQHQQELDVGSSSSSKQKSSKSSSKSERGQPKKMLPPSNTSVPKKRGHDVENSSKEKSSSKKGHGGGRESSSKHSKGSRGRGEEVPPPKSSKKSPSKVSSNLSPISTSSTDSSSSSSSSASSSSSSSNSSSGAINSEEESDDFSPLTMSEQELPLTPKTSSNGRRRSKSPLMPARWNSQSPASAVSPSSSIGPPIKRRKNSSSVPPDTPPDTPKVHSYPRKSKEDKSHSSKNKHKDKKSSKKPSSSSKEKHHHHRSSKKGGGSHNYSDFEISSATEAPSPLSPIPSSASSRNKKRRASAEKSSSKRDGGKKQPKSRKALKYRTSSSSNCSSEEEDSNNSSSSSADLRAANGTSGSNSGREHRGSNHHGSSNVSGYSHASVAGSITAEMKLLKELHNRIGQLEDPHKLQAVVDIVENSGRDLWSTESGITFDFDLCKLSSSTIRKLQEAILL